MFRQVLSTTPLYNEIANDYFSNVKGEEFQEDCTFVSTMRALVSPRMPEGDTVSIAYRSAGFSINSLENKTVVELMESCGMDCPNYLENGECFIFSLTHCSDNNIKTLQKLKQDFTKAFSGWRIVDKVEAFFKKTFSAICFIKPETKNFIIFVDNLDLRKLHYLQCGILAYLPWYFEPAKGVTDQEMELIYSLREKSSEKYESCIAEYAKQFNFRELRIKKLLAGFEHKFEELEMAKIERDLEDVIRRIRNYNETLGQFLTSKRTLESQLLGLERKIASVENESEIMDYFLLNKNIVLETLVDTEMVFSTKGYVSYYDEDAAENAISNHHSYIYRPKGNPCNNIIPEEDMEMLMRAIFLDRKLRMKFCSCYKFVMGGNITPIKYHNYNSAEFGDCTPNTHIDRYACIGNYERTINELLQDNNYIGAIEQCIASTVSLNFSDACVMKEFMARLYGIGDRSVNTRCIELPDGTVVKPKEAIEYLKAQEELAEEKDGEESNG